MANSVNRHQVIVMSKHHIAIRCLLHVHVNIVGRKDKTPGQLYLPQRYTPVRGEEDRGNLKHQGPRTIEQNPSPLELRVLK